MLKYYSLYINDKAFHPFDISYGFQMSNYSIGALDPAYPFGQFLDQKEGVDDPFDFMLGLNNPLQTLSSQQSAAIPVPSSPLNTFSLAVEQPIDNRLFSNSSYQLTIPSIPLSPGVSDGIFPSRSIFNGEAHSQDSEEIPPTSTWYSKFKGDLINLGRNGILASTDKDELHLKVATIFSTFEHDPSSLIFIYNVETNHISSFSYNQIRLLHNDHLPYLRDSYHVYAAIGINLKGQDAGLGLFNLKKISLPVNSNGVHDNRLSRPLIGYYEGELKTMREAILEDESNKYLFNLNDMYEVDGSDKKSFTSYINDGAIGGSEVGSIIIRLRAEEIAERVNVRAVTRHNPNRKNDKKADKLVIEAIKEIPAGTQFLLNYGEQFYDLNDPHYLQMQKAILEQDDHVTRLVRMHAALEPYPGENAYFTANKRYSFVDQVRKWNSILAERDEKGFFNYFKLRQKRFEILYNHMRLFEEVFSLLSEEKRTKVRDLDSRIMNGAKNVKPKKLRQSTALEIYHFLKNYLFEGNPVYPKQSTSIITLDKLNEFPVAKQFLPDVIEIFEHQLYTKYNGTIRAGSDPKPPELLFWFDRRVPKSSPEVLNRYRRQLDDLKDLPLKTSETKRISKFLSDLRNDENRKQEIVWPAAEDLLEEEDATEEKDEQEEEEEKDEREEEAEKDEQEEEEKNDEQEEEEEKKNKNTELLTDEPISPALENVPGPQVSIAMEIIHPTHERVASPTVPYSSPPPEFIASPVNPSGTDQTTLETDEKKDVFKEIEKLIKELVPNEFKEKESPDSPVYYEDSPIYGNMEETLEAKAVTDDSILEVPTEVKEESPLPKEDEKLQILPQKVEDLDIITVAIDPGEQVLAIGSDEKIIAETRKRFPGKKLKKITLASGRIIPVPPNEEEEKKEDVIESDEESLEPDTQEDNEFKPIRERETGPPPLGYCQMIIGSQPTKYCEKHTTYGKYCEEHMPVMYGLEVKDGILVASTRILDASLPFSLNSRVPLVEDYLVNPSRSIPEDGYPVRSRYTYIFDHHNLLLSGETLTFNTSSPESGPLHALTRLPKGNPKINSFFEKVGEMVYLSRKPKRKIKPGEMIAVEDPNPPLDNQDEKGETKQADILKPLTKALIKIYNNIHDTTNDRKDFKRHTEKKLDEFLDESFEGEFEQIAQNLSEFYFDDPKKFKRETERILLAYYKEEEKADLEEKKQKLYKKKTNPNKDYKRRKKHRLKPSKSKKKLPLQTEEQKVVNKETGTDQEVETEEDDSVERRHKTELKEDDEELEKKEETFLNERCAHYGVAINPSTLKGAGNGLFALKVFEKGKLVIPYVEDVTNPEFFSSTPIAGQYVMEASSTSFWNAESIWSGVARFANKYTKGNYRRAFTDEKGVFHKGLYGNNCKFQGFVDPRAPGLTARLVNFRRIEAFEEILVGYGPGHRFKVWEEGDGDEENDQDLELKEEEEEEEKSLGNDTSEEEFHSIAEGSSITSAPLPEIPSSFPELGTIINPFIFGTPPIKKEFEEIDKKYPISMSDLEIEQIRSQNRKKRKNQKNFIEDSSKKAKTSASFRIERQSHADCLFELSQETNSPPALPNRSRVFDIMDVIWAS